MYIYNIKGSVSLLNIR